MTYKQAYDKIIDAYFKDEIEPLAPMFCFCGTLCDNVQDWFGHPRRFHKDFKGYYGDEFVKMESALLNTMEAEICGCIRRDNPKYESALFSGMCAAIEVLKDIHRSRGENVDELPALKPRKQII